jgi:uncharacterized Zn-finger protein
MPPVKKTASALTTTTPAAKKTDKKPTASAHPTTPAAVDAPLFAEKVTATTAKVFCDGGGGALGHPRVFINLTAAGWKDCGYCGRRFVLA